MAAALAPGVPLSKILSGPPPPGVQPLSPIVPRGRQDALYGIGLTITLIAFILMCGRLYFNYNDQRRRLG